MPKYILQISLVLLVTTVWAAGDDEASDSATTESVTDQPSLPPFFEWGQVGSDFFELNWNTEALGKDYADIIKLTALGLTISFAGMNFSYFLSGHLILTHLFPDNTYRVVLEALKGEHLVLFCSEDVKTKPFVRLVRKHHHNQWMFRASSTAEKQSDCQSSLIQVNLTMKTPYLFTAFKSTNAALCNILFFRANFALRTVT
ncbi:hypothetical protein TSMEX_008144 [Taenia solium]|eukprot:TsM_000195700 transcript=TsM_000195700 gene=TsM_000195700